MYRSIPALLAILAGLNVPSTAMDLKEIAKFTTTEQSMYTGAALNMLAYTYAANGNVAKARCITSWYFGPAGTNKGPYDISLAIAPRQRGGEKYHVEGVIMGAADKACGADPKPSGR